MRHVVHRRRFVEAYGWSMVASSATGAAAAGAFGRGHGRRREKAQEGAFKFRRRRPLPGRGRATHGAQGGHRRRHALGAGAVARACRLKFILWRAIAGSRLGTGLN